jgi:putative copper export protein
MTPDFVSVLLRGLAFLSLCQALGGGLFLAWQRAGLPASRSPLARLVAGAAIVAGLLLGAQALLEAGRMAGEWAGVRDAGLQRLAFSSPIGTVLALRCIALAGAVASLVLVRRAALPLAGASLLVGAGSFALTGHTTGLHARALGGALLALHVALVFAWVGALQPLRLVVQREPALVAARVVAAFSRAAAWSVPLLPVAGVALAVLLVPSLADLATPYGRLLLAKSGGLLLALLLAALNHEVHGPELATGGPPAARRFARTVLVEALLLAGVLMATAAMTGWYSPEG